MVSRRMQPLTEEVPILTKLEEFLDYCEDKELSERTIQQYRDSGKKFVEVCGNLTEVGQEEITQFIRSFDQSAGGVNFYLRGLRTFFNYCELGLKITLKKEPKKAIIPFTDKQVANLFTQIDRGTFVGERDYLMLHMLFDTGMRISELTSLCKSRIYRGYVVVIGKGNKERIVPIGKQCQELLSEYIKLINNIDDGEPIFLTGNHIPMDRHRVNERLKVYGKKANIKGVRVSPHTFRHTFARNFLMSGGNMFALQKILGHQSLEMVKKYTYLFTHDIIEEHKKCSPCDRLIKEEKDSARKKKRQKK